MKPHLPLSLLKTLLATAAVAVTVTLCAVTYEPSPSASAHVPADTGAAPTPSAHRLPNTVSFSSALQGTDQEAAQQAAIAAVQPFSRNFSYCSLSFDTPQASADAEISALTSVMPATAEGSTPVSTVSAYPVGATAPTGVGSGAGVALASAGNDISGTSVALASAETAAVTPLTVSENSAVIDPNSLETPFVHIYQDEYDKLSDEAKKNYYWRRGWPAGQYNIYWFGLPSSETRFNTPNNDYPRVFAGIRYSSHDSGLMAGGLIYIQGGASAHLVNASYSGGSVPPVYISLGNVTFTGETFSLTHNQCDAIYLGEGSVNISVSGSVTFSDNSCGIQLHYGGASSTFTLCDSRVVTFSGNDTAIYFHGTTTLSDNGDVTFSGNGTAISSLTLTLSNNGDVTFSGNGTAISAKTLTLSGNGDVSFRGNSGGAIINGISYNGRTFTLSDNKSVTFSDNSGRGAIDIDSGTFTLRGNGNVSFRGNTASEGGGAISYSAPDTFTLSDNGNVTFSGNSASDNGGAISNSGTFTLRGNESVTFSGNSASDDGGAISNSGTFTLRGNESVTFSGNSASDDGGAIYNSGSGTFTLSGNGDVTFSGNSATSTSSSFGGKGGAIYNSGTFTLSDNGDVTFSENSTSHADVFRGGAVYNSGTFTVSGNGDVSFSGNSGGAISNSVGVLTLSDNKSVTFCRNSVSSGDYVISNSDDGVLTLSGNGDVTFSGNSGGVISNSDGVLTLSDNKSVTFCRNSVSSEGYEISNSEGGVLTLSGNGDVTFSGNSGGAIINGSGSNYPSKFTLSGNGDVTFSGYSGGAIYNRDTFTLSGNGDVTFSGNSGGAIINGGRPRSSSFTLSDNGNVTFSGNSVAAGTDSEARGGAICNGSIYRTPKPKFTLSGNSAVTFSENSAHGSAKGGAIYNDGTFTLSDNSAVTFCGNVASGDSGNSSGGAIYSDYTFTLSGNGDVTFSGNSVAAGTDSKVGGGAIHCSYGTFTLSGNGDVTFSGNSAAAGTDSEVRGGAIYSDATFTLSGNGDVTFSGNSVAAGTDSEVRGGAIYNDGGTFTLSDNGDVLFEKNYENTNGIYRLRSIYSARKLNLSASEGKSITFRDGVYVSASWDNSSTVNLNQDYTDDAGVVHKSTGDIILTGATTEADLREVKGGVDGTEEEIQNSRTSEFAGMATLYGGRLIVEDRAILNGQGITTAEGANATLRLNNGTLNESGYAVTIGAGSTLELAGSNTITASALNLQDGATLAFCINGQEESLLNLNSTLRTGNSLNVTISTAAGRPNTGNIVALLTLNNAAGYDTQNWTAEKVHVSGASFEELAWVGGVLTLRNGWDVNIGETTTTLTIHGPSTIYQAETLSPWTNAERDFIIRGAADDAALAVTPVVQAHSLTAEAVELDLGSAAQQIGTLYIVDATVTSSHTDSSRGFVDGDVIIGTNGTLRLTKFDALGWGGSATDSITLEGGEGEEAVLELGARQTMATNITLNGYSRVTSTAQPTGSDNNAPSFDTFGGRISATGEHNTIEVALARRSALTIDVAEGGALEISGDVRPSASGIGGGITKTGEGTLLFSGENKSLRNFRQTAGQTRFVGDVVFNGASGGSLSLSGGAQLDLQGNVVFDDSVQVLGNAQMVFTGDGETAVMQHQIKTTYVGTAAAMTVQGFRTFRATLEDESNTSLFSIYGSALFRDNAEVTVEDVNSTWWGTGFKVSGNLTLADNDALRFRNNSANGDGGAIDNAGSVSLSNNGVVTFAGNRATSHGGAIDNWGGTCILENNQNVTFRDNRLTSTYGAAIYNSGTLTLRGNGDVLFAGNAEISDNSYRLRSIYSTGTLNLSAAEGKSILFRDSVYASGTANLNADGEGDIIFTGATTEDDLREVKGGAAGTATEIANSRSSILDATVTLYGGTLQVRDGAGLTVKNLTAVNGATLVLHDASFATTGDSTLTAVTVSGNSTLTAQTGATLTLQQALVNSGTLTVGGTLDVSALTLNTTAATHIDVNGNSGDNGFLKDDLASVQVVDGGTTVNNNATIKHGTLTLTLNGNGTAISEGEVDYSTYYINGGSADLSAIIAVSPMAAVEMDGGTLTIDADTATEIRHDNTASLLFTAHQTGSKEFAQYRELVFADIISSSYGGAIDNSGSGTFTLSGNGVVSFSGNSASSTSSYAAGGAIDNFGTFSLSGNEVVTFSGNTASYLGGAIANSGTFTLSGNESVTFSGNSTSSDSFYAYGGAIRNYGTFTLSGNGDVLFEKNAEISNGIYRLRSIYSSNGTLNLSAAEGKSITFRDGVYASGTVNLNQEGSGDIILTGATTEADLREVKGGIDGTAGEIRISRTSEFATLATLYGGRLIVEDGAILNGQGITTAEGANATLRLNNGTLNEGGYAVTIGTGSTLELAGSNTITASALDLQDGATLSFCLGEQAGSLLSLNGTLQTGNALNVTITPAEGMSVMSDTVTLLTLNNAAGYDTQNWTAEKVHISGASFDDLSWANGVLTLRTGGSDWDVSRGETTTTLTIHGPSSINQAETLAQWTNTERDFIIRGAADDAALAVAPVVQAHSLTAEGVELDLGSAAQQIGTLYIVDATVTSSHTDSSRGFVDGDVVIGTNGTLRLTKFDALGWGGSATDSITLEGSEGEEAVLELGARQTMGTNLALNGYSRVTSTAQPTGSGNNAPSFDTFGGRISATGEHNTIEVALAQRSALTIDVAEGGELEISGDVRPSASGIGGGITKTGEGTLLFSGENKSLRNFRQTAGQTRFVGDVVFNGASGGSLSLSGGAQLDLQGNVVFDDNVQAIGNAQMVFTGDGETAVMQDRFKTTDVAAAAALTVQGFRTFRATLEDASNTTLFSINGSVLFRDNAEVTVEDVNSTGWGTGFNVGGNLTFADNGALLFRNLRADVGGAFMVNTNGQVTLTGNEQVEFSDNTIGSYGGAFRVNDGAAMEMAGNARLLFTDNSAGIYGGAISTSGALSMTGSEELRFTGNSGGNGGAISNNSAQAVLRIADNGSVRFEDNTANSTGGALHVGAGNVYLQGNEEVVFSGNKAASSSGGAVYNAGTFTVSDNGDVLFEKNAEVSGGTYRLRSIYSTGTLNLSAAEGKSITFRDGVYASGAVALNQAGTGDIILTGATTEADLREVKGGTDGTAAEIQNSRTSEFATMATLYGGRLIVEDGAILNGRGITTAEGANATLRLNNGTLNESDYAVTIGAGSTLELDGRSTMTASALNLQDGATLAFCINGQEESLLNLNGTLQTGNTLKLSVTRGEKETGTRDCSILLRLNNAANYNTQNWTAEKVQVSGASFSNLIWASGLLLLREEAPEWDVSIGETATTLTIHGPSYIGFGATMAPWTNDSRDFIIRSAAEDASLTFSPAVTARSLTTEGVNLDFDAKMQNIGSLIIRDAVVTSAYTNNARGFVNGEVIIGTDGTLRLTKLDAIGWNTTATPRITMEGESGHEAVLELGARQTMTTQLVLNGNSVVRSTESPTGSGNNAPCFDSLGGTITATGENNRIEVGLTQRQNMTVTVEAEGELEMSGGIVTSANGNGGSFAKEGAGALRFTAQEALAISNFIQNAGTTEFSGAQTTVNGYTQNGGTLQVEGQTTLRGQTSVNGGRISIGEGESAALHLRNTTLNMAQGSELQAGGIIHMTADATGALALSGDVTLSSDGLSGQDGTYAVLNHADVQVLGDAAISNVRLENTLMDLAEACSVNLSHVMLAATARLTDEPATAHLDDVTAELVVGVNTTVTGHNTLRAGSTLVQNGQEALTLTPPAHSSVTQLESTSFDSLTLTGTSLVLELRGYEPEMHNYATFIALSFTSGTDYATFDAALPVLMSTDGEHYAQAYHLQNGNGTTLFFESRAAGIIPEPATATLSLLALAALAARRRRRG